MENIEIRRAVPGDEPVILEFIRELAEYEHMSDEVVATEELLHDWLFEKRAAEVLFAVEDGKEVGFALFFGNFSTFLGRGGIYLEDLFVKKEHRGHGYGRALLRALARLALERGCGRLGLPRLEPAEHRLLPLPRRRPPERLDHLPPHRQDPRGHGGMSNRPGRDVRGGFFTPPPDRARCVWY
jgi:GNAT superfamily N-acetyltransferase